MSLNEESALRIRCLDERRCDITVLSLPVLLFSSIGDIISNLMCICNVLFFLQFSEEEADEEDGVQVSVQIVVRV